MGNSLAEGTRAVGSSATRTTVFTGPNPIGVSESEGLVRSGYEGGSHIDYPIDSDIQV